jgi:hypothetical protein
MVLRLEEDNKVEVQAAYFDSPIALDVPQPYRHRGNPSPTPTFLDFASHDAP